MLLNYPVGDVHNEATAKPILRKDLLLTNYKVQITQEFTGIMLTDHQDHSI